MANNESKTETTRENLRPAQCYTCEGWFLLEAGERRADCDFCLETRARGNARRSDIDRANDAMNWATGRAA